MSRIIIIGPDGCGKDTLARLIRDSSSLRYPEPTSLTWARTIAEWQDGRDITQWWRQRRDHRDEWIDVFNRLIRDEGVTAVADRVFKLADIYTGMRTAEELSAVLVNHDIDGVVWAFNPGIRHQHGIQMTPELSCDLTMSFNCLWCVATATPRGARRVVTFMIGRDSCVS